ncbi:hypothetical protein QYS49_35700 [Marivirga salinae]|uniref:SCO family protein n=1 Tax=Marivirga salinarum TaxID=3059078 RepID=A0AA51RBN4_9BACT|nr:hypothetical protein [Marivirga sp. BDSF4-3]WMN10698.1 hypothetical protein QYS49_35700 [Marivirga sp. BDSF4-3]
MKKSKILILLFTLTFPVILYLFLRSYGQNEFALPVFFENAEKKFCNDSTVKSNSVQVFSLNLQDSFKLEDIYNADFKIIHFPNPQDSEIQTLKNELNRVFNTFDELSINLLSFEAITNKMGEMKVSKAFLPGQRSETYLYPTAEKDVFVNCIYAFPTQDWEGEHPTEEIIAFDHTLVLLDEENRIRGYYDGYETKEVDRLILEIRVLLSNR